MDEDTKRIIARSITKCVATVAAAAVCSILLFLTGGKEGAGWFAFALVIIWGNAI